MVKVGFTEPQAQAVIATVRKVWLDKA